MGFYRHAKPRLLQHSTLGFYGVGMGHVNLLWQHGGLVLYFGAEVLQNSLRLEANDRLSFDRRGDIPVGGKNPRLADGLGIGGEKRAGADVLGIGFFIGEKAQTDQPINLAL